MRRFIVATVIALLAYSGTAFAASVEVRPTVLFSVSQVADIDPGDPPSEEWLNRWEGHGAEQAHHGCDGGDAVEWSLVLAQPPVLDGVLLAATFAAAGRIERVTDVEGEPHGQGSTGTVHFTLFMDAEFVLTEAVVRLPEEPRPTTRLLLSETDCVEAVVDGEDAGS